MDSGSALKRFERLVRRVFSAALLVSGSHGGFAQTVPTGFSDALVMGGWNQLTGFTFDANGRWYVWERTGKVWIVENGVKLATPLIDISEEVGNWGDHGLLGFALDPNFTTNGKIYLMYVVDRYYWLNHGLAGYDQYASTPNSATFMRITRYTAIGPAHNAVDVNSRSVLFGETPQTAAAITHGSHGVGTLLFGTDGTLLASMGDGASYNVVDVGSNGDTYFQQALTDGILTAKTNVGAMRAQLIDCANGKILRLDPNTGDGIASNPFYDGRNRAQWKAGCGPWECAIHTGWC